MISVAHMHTHTCVWCFDGWREEQRMSTSNNGNNVNKPPAASDGYALFDACRSVGAPLRQLPRDFRSFGVGGASHPCVGRVSSEEGSSTVPSARGKFMPYLAVERFLLGARSPRLPSRVGSRGLPHLGQEHRLSLSRSLSPLSRSLFLDGSRTFVFRR